MDRSENIQTVEVCSLVGRSRAHATANIRMTDNAFVFLKSYLATGDERLQRCSFICSETLERRLGQVTCTFRTGVQVLRRF